jgi:hypothetical protein
MCLLTRHKVEEHGSDGIDSRRVGYVGAGKAKDAHHTVRNRPTFAGQMVGKAVGRVYERG